jgi:cytochrome c553
MAIMVTGGIVGVGLLTQIVLSLFSLYGPKGKIVILVVGLLALGVSGLVYVKVIKPYLDDEKLNSKKRQQKDERPPSSDSPSKMESVLTGEFKPKGPWSGKEGGMVRAFFDKDELAYEEKLKAQREGEQAAVLAWIKSATDARKKSYEENRFELPAELVGKPMTPTMQFDSKFVKVKTIINERCATCHAPGKEKEEPRLDNFEGITKILGPGDSSKKVDVAPAPPMPMPMVEPMPNLSGPSKLELLVSGPFIPGKSLNDKPGGMVGAFFDKEDDFKDALKKKSKDLPRLTTERENEQAAFLAWIKSPADARKVTYEMDKFPLPASLAGKPFTQQFKSDDKSVMVKKMIVTRCVACHGDGGEKADLPLEEFDQLLEFLKPAEAKK